MKKILLTGIQPSGKPHIGNYFGMMKQVVDMQDEYESFPFIANYHSLNTIQNAETMRENIINVVLDYLAVGLDPQKVTLFKQSDVPQVTELCWILNTITTMPYLMRAHAFKDAEAKNKEISIGIFDYPILMAADILIQDTDVVPVGKDQQQHVEMARDIAEKFNRIYGETFKLPKSLIKEDVAVILGTDGQKMSKSYGNTIPLFAEDEEIQKLVMSIPTDSKGVDESKDPEECNVFALHKLFSSEDELGEIKRRYVEGGMGYKESKDILVKNIQNFIQPLREKRKELENNKEIIVAEILKKGGETARERAEEKMKEVRAKIGIF
ncbi:tryptophan--tRNA ligase [Patescibacteria group bacterium]|nr:tryptophan--tRNA ligase [Patescibacteria group bacterium]MCG2694827.1 tryptophan--tRNA ligase [Candidatus Parcubacteria bacterium]